ncbi:MAG: DUF6702 family protein [Saprospiraceae bacterium]
MKSLFFLSVLLLIGYGSSAHTPDLSTAFLAEQENGAWVVQLNSALTAFTHEIHYNFSDSAYTSPEEFQQLLVAYCRDNIVIVANGSDTLSYSNIAVRVGHATDVVFQIEHMPEVLSELTVTNTIFKDIGRSQSTLVILKKGLKKTQVSLNKENGFMTSFEISSNGIRPNVLKQGFNVSYWTWAFVGALVLVVLGSFFWR